MTILNKRRIIIALLCWPGVLEAQIIVGPPEHTAAPEGNYAERFAYGYAHIRSGGREFYIDSTGRKAFDSIAPDSKANLGEENGVVKVLKNGKAGLMTVGGQWLLPAIYDSVDVDFMAIWKVKKDGKKTYAAADGLLLPFFEDVGYLDGTYFDVKQAGKWGIYSTKEKKLVIPARYDGFDYCGGCGSPSNYVYAKKDSKWGIIAYNEQELVPFLYDHSHTMMRSDEWVQSFSKDVQEVLIHIPSGKVYPQTDSLSWELLGNGLLVKRQGGKCGVYSPEGRELLPMEYETIGVPNDNSYLGYDGPYAIVTKNGKKGLVNVNGGILFQPVYEDIQVYDHYFVLVKNGLASLLDSAKHVLVPASYSDISHVNEYFYSSGSKGIHVFRIKNKAIYGLYFADIKKLIPPAFHHLKLISASDDYKDAYIEGAYQGIKTLFDLQGNEVRPLTSDHEESKHSSLTDHIEKVAIPKVNRQLVNIKKAYEDVEALNGGTCWLVTRNGKFGIVGADGKTWIPCVYDDLLINRYDQGHEINFPLLGSQNGLWKYYDRSGQPIQVEGVPGSSFQIQ